MIANEIEARELSLYATNNGALRFGRIDAIINNLAKKVNAGTYDAQLALKAWQYVADDSAKAYAKEFCGPDFDPRQFSKATRQLAAVEIAEYYSEAVRDYAEDMAKDTANRKRWTLSAIRNAHKGHFFDRKTLQFFGETMGNFAVRCEGGAVYVERVKPAQNAPIPSETVGKRWRFNPESGDLV